MPIYKMSGKKNGKQKYRVRINYQDAYGIYRQSERIAYGLEDAKDLEMRLGKELKETPATSRMTVQTLYEDYVAAMKTEVRESSLSKSRSNLTNHVLPSLGGVRIDKLTIPILQKWKTDLSENTVALRTKKSVFSAFNALLNYAVRMQYLTVNLLGRVGNFKDTESMPTEMLYYTGDEFSLYRTAAMTHTQSATHDYEWNYYVFFMIAFYMGMRKGEIHALRWSDIVDDYIDIRRSISQKLKGDDRETGTKNKSSVRIIQMPLPLVVILHEHKERWFLTLLDGGIKTIETTEGE
jgi:hypothetical protein